MQMNEEVIRSLKQLSPMRLSSLVQLLFTKAQESLSHENYEEEDEEETPSVQRRYSTPVRSVAQNPMQEIVATDPVIATTIKELVSATPPSEIIKKITEFLNVIRSEPAPTHSVFFDADNVGSDPSDDADIYNRLPEPDYHSTLRN